MFYELLRRWGGGGGERVAGCGNFFVLTQKRKISSPHIGALVFSTSSQLFPRSLIPAHAIGRAAL